MANVRKLCDYVSSPSATEKDEDIDEDAATLTSYEANSTLKRVNIFM